MVTLSRSHGSRALGDEDTSGVSWRSHLPGGQAAMFTRQWRRLAPATGTTRFQHSRTVPPFLVVSFRDSGRKFAWVTMSYNCPRELKKGEIGSWERVTGAWSYLWQLGAELTRGPRLASVAALDGPCACRRYCRKFRVCVCLCTLFEGVNIALATRQFFPVACQD